MVIPPSYGSQEYWEQRYSRETVDSSEDHPSPFHSWYFSYEEMRPLLLPLIVGTELADAILLNSSVPGASDGAATKQKQQPEAQSVSSSKEEDKAVSSETQADEVKEENAEHTGTNMKDEDQVRDEYNDEDEEERASDDEISGDCSEAEGEFEEAYSDEEDADDDETDVIRAPLSNSPVAILEVGCGDVPMGTGLVMDLPSEHVGRVVCIDYSASVIQKMEDQYGTKSEPDTKKRKTNNTEQESSVQHTSSQLEFEKVDARKMPYADDTFHMVMEKGTLDAMLSDRESGSSNCQQIIRECARVVKTGGVIVLVSHLNAFDPSGIDWMEDVVFGGLKSCDASSWSIEVHGNDGGDEPPGPAVYVIHKKPKDTKSSTIPVQFFSY